MKAGAENLSRTGAYIAKVIEETKRCGRKAICFVTGVPGSGKTLAGLNIATERMRSSEDEYAVRRHGVGRSKRVLHQRFYASRSVVGHRQLKPREGRRASDAGINRARRHNRWQIADRFRPWWRPIQHVRHDATSFRLTSPSSSGQLYPHMIQNNAAARQPPKVRSDIEVAGIATIVLSVTALLLLQFGEATMIAYLLLKSELDENGAAVMYFSLLGLVLSLASIHRRVKAGQG